MSETSASITGADARRPPLDGDEALLAAAGRGGDEHAFVTLAGRHHAALCALAGCWPGGGATATRDVAQAWLAVLGEGPAQAPGAALGDGGGAERAEPARSVRARVGHEVVAGALARGRVAFAAPDLPAVGVTPERFFGGSDELWPGEWADPPRPWGSVASRRLATADVPRLLADGVCSLDPGARAAVTLCDVHGWSVPDCAIALDCPDAVARTFLRRGREALRALLEREVDIA